MKRIIISAYAFLIAFMAIGICAKADTHLQDPNFSWNWLENASAKDYSTQGDFVCGGGTGWDGLTPWYTEYIQGDHVVTVYNRLTGVLMAISAEPFMAKEQNEYDEWIDNFYNVGVGNISPSTVFEDWQEVFPEYENGFAVWWSDKTDYYVTADYYVESAAQLYMILADDGFEPPEPENPWSQYEPKFYLKIESATLMGMANVGVHGDKLEYTITWDTTQSYVAGREQDFGIQVAISPQNNTDNGGIFYNWKTKKFVKQTDIYPCNMATIAFPFTFGDIERLGWFGTNFLDNNFYIYVRVVNIDTNEPVTNKWTWFQVTKMFELRGSGTQTESGEGNLGESTSVGSWENGVFQYTDGRDPGDNTNEDGTQNSNGSSVSPQASASGINNYEPTAPEESGFSANITNLKGSLSDMIRLVGQIPSMLAQLMLFMPSWLITLMSASIGLLLVVGIIKTLT